MPGRGRTHSVFHTAGGRGMNHSDRFSPLRRVLLTGVACSHTRALNHTGHPWHGRRKERPAEPVAPGTIMPPKVVIVGVGLALSRSDGVVQMCLRASRQAWHSALDGGERRERRQLANQTVDIFSDTFCPLVLLKRHSLVLSLVWLNQAMSDEVLKVYLLGFVYRPGRARKPFETNRQHGYRSHHATESCTRIAEE